MSEQNNSDPKLFGENEQPIDADHQNNAASPNGVPKPKPRRRIIQRSFPATPFEEALELPVAIQNLASGHKIRLQIKYEGTNYERPGF